MRLHWFSPLPPSNTNIANYTLHCIPSLAELAEITVWTSSDQSELGIEEYCEIRQYHPDELNWHELNQGIAVYHIGNNAEFHREIWQVIQNYPGIVVLHDIRLHDLFLGIFRTKIKAYFTLLKLSSMRRLS